MTAPFQGQSGPNGLLLPEPTDDLQLASLLDDWTAGRGPLYRRLADAIRQAVTRGDLPPGSRLPAERLLAERLAVSRSTVVSAYDLLQKHGIIERRQGSGTRVSQAPRRGAAPELHANLTRALSRNTLARRITAGPDESIDLLGAYLLGTSGLPPAAFDGLERELVELSASSGYAPLGHPPLRQAIAAHLSRAGLPTSVDQVLVTQGSQQAMHLIAWYYVQRGDTVIVENPTYPGALDVFNTLGARLAWIPTGRNGADLHALAELTPRTSPRLAYLIPTFQNPVGGVLPEHRRRALARFVVDRGLMLIEDDSLAELALGAEPPPPVASFAPEASILTINSLSKLGWAGLRVGWIRGPEPIITQLGRLKAVSELGGALPSQLIAMRLLAVFDQLRLERRRVLAERFALASRLLQACLPDWSWDPPHGGLCLWVRLPHGNAQEFAQVAQRHGVSIAAGTIASPDGSFEDYLRLPFGQAPAALEEGIRRLARAWQAYVPLQDRRQTLAVIV